jgi:branched-chain amino acid transport system substrate-binding protein
METGMNAVQKNIVAFALAGLGVLAGTGLATPAMAQDEVTIGAAAPLTGPRANLGRYFRQGVDLAVSAAESCLRRRPG